MEILLTSMLSLTFRLVWVDGWMVFGEPWWKQGFPSSPFYPSYFPPNIVKMFSFNYHKRVPSNDNIVS